MQCTSHLHPSFRWKEQSLISPHADVIHFCANNFGLFSFARLGCVSNDARAAPPSSDSLNLRCPPQLPSNPTSNHPHCHPMMLQSGIFAFAFRVSLSVLSHVLRIWFIGGGNNYTRDRTGPCCRWYSPAVSRSLAFYLWEFSASPSPSLSVTGSPFSPFALERRGRKMLPLPLLLLPLPRLPSKFQASARWIDW